jgi:hypothetical protein
MRHSRRRQRANNAVKFRVAKRLCDKQQQTRIHRRQADRITRHQSRQRSEAVGEAEVIELQFVDARVKCMQARHTGRQILRKAATTFVAPSIHDEREHI